MKLKVLLSSAASVGMLAFAFSMVLPTVATLSAYAAAATLMILLIFAQDYLPRSDNNRRHTGTLVPFATGSLSKQSR